MEARLISLGEAMTNTFRSTDRSSLRRSRSLLAALGFTLGMAIAWNQTAIAQQPDIEPRETPSETPSETPTETGPRFACQFVDGSYTVMYYPQSQPNQSYPWAIPSEMGGGWTPERRCNEISRRLEFYRPDGLVELGTGVENGYDIVCVTTQADSRCRIVLTVPPGQDPRQTRDLVFQNIVTADNGQLTEAVNTLVDRGEDLTRIEDILGIDLSELEGGIGRSQIDLRPFLDPADGGTGELLDGGVSASDNPKLNPANFR
jgi:Circadian oscillating protein COP23